MKDVTLESLLEDASRIPAAPGVALELANTCRDPECTIDQLVSVLKCDPALTVKILRMANSAYFASRREIAELGEAVVRLGLRRVQMMAMAFCIMEATSAKSERDKGFDYGYFWGHALVTATFADVMANMNHVALAMEALVAGLLQDIGVLMIQTCAPARYRSVLSSVTRGAEELHVAETRRLGFNHMQAGELLLKQWHIPDPICTVAAYHHQPDAMPSPEGPVHELACICHVGAAVAKFLNHDTGRQQLMAQAAGLAESHFGMTRERLQAVLGLVRMKLDASAQMFDVRLDELMIRRLDAAIRDQIADAAMETSDAPGSNQ